MFFKKNSQQYVQEGLEPLFPRLWRFCLSLTGKQETANDLAQAACLKALENADKFDIGTNLDRWLFTLTRRLWIDELRKQAVRNGNGLFSIEEIELKDTKASPEMNLMARQTLNSVMSLPEAQRSTVMLVYVEGYSYKEASQILDIPIGTVMSRLSAARSKLSDNQNYESNVI